MVRLVTRSQPLDQFADNNWSCADHNIMFSSYFAADEAETLDSIYRNDADAIAGMVLFSGFMKRGLTQTIFCTLAATAEFAKTGKGPITHKYANILASASFSKNLTIESVVLKSV